MTKDELKLIEQQHLEAVLGCNAQQNGRKAQPGEALTIPYTDLPEAKPDSPLYHEWSFYRDEVGRLLGEGHDGRFILIKGKEIIGIWDTHAEAQAVALQKYLRQPCLIHQIRRWEPIVRLPRRLWGCQA
jgi:hypothetical protein